MSELDLGLRAQAAGIATGEIDAAELLDACLERIEQRNGDLNAVVATFPEQSRRMLAEAPDGPMRGVPVVIKDEWSLPWRAERVGAADTLVELAPGESGPYVALRDAGAVIVGVANMHELGSGSTGNSSVYGAAHNPWDLSRCPGGSSSGPASAVAGGLVAGAVGADGLGSIRYPAGYCGLTGLKPTFGRSAMAGHHIPNTETIVSGPLCADAADSRLLASSLFGEELEAGQPPALRIGVVRDPLWSDSQPGVREACELGLEALRSEVAGELIEIELPELELWTLAAVLVAQAEEAHLLTAEKLNSLDPELSPINRGLLKLRAILPSTITARARLVRARARRELAGMFESVDVLAWPTLPAIAPPLDNPLVELPSGTTTADQANVGHGALANLTGIPGISVPVGLSEGLPVGLQLLGAWGSDAMLLDAAEALERATSREFVQLRAPQHQAATSSASPPGVPR
jgi:Asp-tRNA(Asn)/Glu-tRNA(Gln) amidotransferase A subunit family amidase